MIRYINSAIYIIINIMTFSQRSYSLKQLSPKLKETVYPEDIQCIIQSVNGIGGIYISNLQAAQNLSTLQKYKIKAVLTAAADTKLFYNKSDIPFHLILPALDHENFPIQKFFADSFDFIDKYTQVTNVLIHCLAGISRSVSLLIAYLIKKEKISYQLAYALVKSRRKIIHPNQGFIRKLKLFSQYNTKNIKSINLNPEVYQIRISKIRPTSPSFSNTKNYYFANHYFDNNRGFNSQAQNKEIMKESISSSLQKYKYMTASNSKLNEIKKYQHHYQTNNEYQLDNLKYYNLASKKTQLNHRHEPYVNNFRHYF